MGHDATQPNPPDALADINLYCLECGYNLRGLSGDPRRCPECGYLNPLGDAVLPPERIRRELRRMEHAPALCVAVLAWAFLGCFQLLLTPSASDFLFCGFLPLGLVGGPLYLVCIERFKANCMGRPGWFRLLITYQLLGLGVFCAAVSPLVVFFLDNLARVRGGNLACEEPVMMRAPFVLIVAVIGAWWVRRSIRPAIHDMTRPMATQRARERLRKELQRKS